MLNKIKHQTILTNILIDFYKDSYISPHLGFKGGTSLYLFYSLPRFSVDLDFNLIGKIDEKILIKSIGNSLKKYLTNVEFSNKHYTYLWTGSYSLDSQRVKVEISKRDLGAEYNYLPFYGVTISVLKKDYAFAHKLCAITDRNTVTSRDIFDAVFCFRQMFSINEGVVKTRTGKNLNDYLLYLKDFVVKNYSEKSILFGLGELVAENEKKDLKKNLINDFLIQIDIFLQNY